MTHSNTELITYVEFKEILYTVGVSERFCHENENIIRERYSHHLFDLTIETFKKVDAGIYLITDRWQKHGGILQEDLNNFDDAASWINSVIAQK